MNIKEYISSGILEQYLVGGLSPELQREVLENVRKYPEIKSELEEIELALEQFALLHQVEPAAGTLASIQQKIAAEDKGNSTTPATASGGSRNAWIGALGALLIIATFFAAYAYSQWQQAEKEREQIQQNLTQLQIACDETAAQLDQYQRKMAIIRDPGNKPVYMGGTALSPSALAAVHWNPEKKIAYLDIINLPPPPPGKQYQLWAIIDGSPTNMDVFDVNTEGDALLEVPFFEAPQAFAVTLEPAGGSPGPTLDQMFVVGNVS